MPATGKSNNKAYLEGMKGNTIVHFVCFETILESEPFMKRWKEFTHSSGSNRDVILQQSKKNKQCLYIAQHGFKTTDDTQFEFYGERASSRIIQERIKTTVIGGYSLLQSESSGEAARGESKIFMFLPNGRANLTLYKEVPFQRKLNIYEAYYQSCNYAYILEYFIPSSNAAALKEYLRNNDNSEMDIYNEYAHIKDAARGDKEGNYVWPSW